MEAASEEVKLLQACLNDLTSVLALSGLWSGREPSAVIASLIDAVCEMLRLDLAYARCGAVGDQDALELLRVSNREHSTPDDAGQAAGELQVWLRSALPSVAATIPNPIGAGEMNVVFFRLGLRDEDGVLLAGSLRSGFPAVTEMLLLRVAANQVSVWLHEARLLSEQQRAAQVLEQRVAERTEQLTAINEVLTERIAELRRSEQRLGIQYAITRILNKSDDLLAASSRFLAEIGESMHWQWGALWVVDRDAGVIRCHTMWQTPGLSAQEFAISAFNDINRNSAFGRG